MKLPWGLKIPDGPFTSRERPVNNTAAKLSIFDIIDQMAKIIEAGYQPTCIRVSPKVRDYLRERERCEPKKRRWGTV